MLFRNNIMTPELINIIDNYTEELYPEFIITDKYNTAILGVCSTHKEMVRVTVNNPSCLVWENLNNAEYDLL